MQGCHFYKNYRYDRHTLEAPEWKAAVTCKQCVVAWLLLVSFEDVNWIRFQRLLEPLTTPYTKSCFIRIPFCASKSEAGPNVGCCRTVWTKSGLIFSENKTTPLTVLGLAVFFFSVFCLLQCCIERKTVNFIKTSMRPNTLHSLAKET